MIRSDGMGWETDQHTVSRKGRRVPILTMEVDGVGHTVLGIRSQVLGVRCYGGDRSRGLRLTTLTWLHTSLTELIMDANDRSRFGHGLIHGVSFIDAEHTIRYDAQSIGSRLLRLMAHDSWRC